VSAERVALIPQCSECGTLWLPADGERWGAYLTIDEPPELAFYCRTSRCASSRIRRGLVTDQQDTFEGEQKATTGVNSIEEIPRFEVAAHDSRAAT
jgi:hypothetical protein